MEVTENKENFNEDMGQLEKVLKEVGVCKKLTKIECSSGSKKGDNYMSKVKRVVVEGVNQADEAFKASYIIKRPVDHKRRREYFRCDPAFKHEIKVYKHVLPTLNEQLGDTVFAKVIYAGEDTQGDMIILEDLQESGFVQRPREEPLNKKDIDAILKEISRFHAASIFLKHSDRRKFDEVAQHLNEVVYCPDAFKLHNTTIDASIRQAVASLATSSKEESTAVAIESIKEFEGNLWEKMQSFVLSDDDSLKLISHGELRVNNIMFKDGENGERSVRFLDLQTMRYAYPIFDVMHLIYTSTDRSLPEADVKAIISDYCKFLDGHIDKVFGEQGAEQARLMKMKYSYDSMMDQYQNFAVYGLGVAMWILPAVTFDQENIPDLDIIADKIANSEEVDMSKYLTPRYHERLRQVVNEYVVGNYFKPQSAT